MSKKNKKEETKKEETKKEVVKEELTISNTLDRGSYCIFFVKPDNEAKRNELRNTGKVISETTISSNTLGDSIDEINIVVKK